MSNHKHPKMSVRPPVDVRETAKASLDVHGWTMQEFITACLEIVGRDPDKLLPVIAAARPEIKRGRPPKQVDHPAK